MTTNKENGTGYWWHAWGGILPEDMEFGGSWAVVILGPSFVPPEEVANVEPIEEVVKLGLSYLTTWDHEPSDEEKETLTPEKFLD